MGRGLRGSHAMKKTASGFALGLVCALALDCAIAQQTAAPVDVPMQVDASTASSDAWISTRIKAALVPLVREQRGAVGVEVSHGVVVLTGSVEGELTRQQVIALCAQTRGVVTVDAAALKIAGLPSPR